jgi:cholesterol oxidase
MFVGETDWVVVGSGFGGSVSALRLAEKGHRVCVLESGRRFSDEEMPRSTFDVRRYFFAPRLGLKGIFRMSFFRDVTILSGAGVGGGSLGYANTLYVAPDAFYRDPQWAGLADWKAELAPHYETAQRMLGVVDVATDDPVDDLLREWATEGGFGDTYGKTRVGVFFGDGPGTEVADPYFGGEGPARTGCQACGRCMIGCPHGAKNTLVKNYLWLAERRGATVRPERTVVDVRPLGEDGSEGWEVVHERTGAWGRRRDRQAVRCRGVVLAAGALGTNRLLQRCRLNGSLRLPSVLGEKVRTNSEAILAVTLPPDVAEGIQRRVAISGSVYPDPHTHVETVVYGEGGNAMRGLFTLLVGDGTRLTRPLKLAGQLARHPVRLARLLGSRDWSRRTVIVLVMQSLDNAIALRARRTRSGDVRLRTEQDPDNPNPTFIPAANAFAEWLAQRTGGIAQSSVMEALANVPSTAHILGGAVIGASPADGVVDRRQRVFGYENLLVCDGAAVPANVGVNPSLTITAMAERAMTFVEPAPGAMPAPVVAVATPIDAALGEPEPA